MNTTSHTPTSLTPFAISSHTDSRTPDRASQSGGSRASGFEQLRHLSGNVGYIDVRRFQELEAGTALTAGILESLAGSNALIIDLRRHEGGDQAAAALFASHFFDTESVHLDAVYCTDAGRRRAGSKPTRPGCRYVGGEVYLLVGSRSSATAIGLARMLQTLGRGIVVGELASDAVISADLPVPEAFALTAAHRAALQAVPSVA